MPLRIPWVPYSRERTEKEEQTRGKEKPVWINLYDRLYRERVLFLCKEIQTPFVNRFIALLLLLYLDTDIYGNYIDTDVYIYINSPGGRADGSLAIYDTMDYILADVCTIAMGSTASGASLILVGGTVSKRIAFPNARISIHQPSSAPIRKNIDGLVMEAEDMLELRNTIADIYAQKTGKPVDVIQKDLERDDFRSATEAQDYGIVDRIAKYKK